MVATFPQCFQSPCTCTSESRRRSLTAAARDLKAASLSDTRIAAIAGICDDKYMLDETSDLAFKKYLSHYVGHHQSGCV